MRSLFALISVTLALSVAAGEVFPLSSGQIDALAANDLEITATREGSVGVWTSTVIYGDWTRERSVNVARFDEQGTMVSTTVLSPSSWYSTVHIASSRREAILIEASAIEPPELLVRTISDDAISAPRSLSIRGKVKYFQWTGRAYALLVQDTNGELSMILLDRDGHPMTGRLRFRNSAYGATAACGEGRCFIAFGTGRNALRYAVIEESDFPPQSQERYVMPRQASFDHIGAMGFDELGFYSITTRTGGFHLHRHGFLRTRDSSFEPRSTIAIDAPYAVSPIVTSSHAGAVYIAYLRWLNWTNYTPMVVLRVSAGGVVENITVENIDVPDDWHWRTPLQFIVRDSVEVVWRGTYSGGVYASGIEGNALQTPKPLSAGIAHHKMPRLVRGTTTSLASWVEEFADHQWVYAAILDSDGRPVSTPVRVAESEDYELEDAVIAFDGVNFLLAWKDGWRKTDDTFAQLISQDGQLVGERIELRDFSNQTLSLVWTGSEYWITGVSSDNWTGVMRIAAAGTFLASRNMDVNGDLIMARDEEGQVRGLILTYEGSILAAGPQTWTMYNSASIVDTPEGPILDGWGGGGEKYAPSVLPAVAFGGGASLTIIDTAGWGPGKLVVDSTPQPYPVPKWLGYTMRLSADWTGSEFVVLAGKTLARHHPEGFLRGMISLGEDVRDSVGVAVDPAGVLVVKQRGDVMEAERVALPPL